MPENFRLIVKLSPKASRNAIKGWVEDARGERILKASVTAVPEKGKANEALIELLAKYFDVPKRDFTILRGETDRLKTVEIKGLSTSQTTNISNMKN